MQEQNQLPVFVIDPEPQVDWPVTVELPADGGTIVSYLFMGRFKVLSHAAYDALTTDAPPAEGEAVVELRTAQQLAADAAKFVQVMTGWTGPADPQGNPVPFSAETLTAQVTGPRGLPLSNGIWRALSEIRWGAAAKNSVPPPAIG